MRSCQQLKNKKNQNSLYLRLKRRFNNYLSLRFIKNYRITRYRIDEKNSVLNKPRSRQNTKNFLC